MLRDCSTPVSNGEPPSLRRATSRPLLCPLCPLRDDRRLCAVSTASSLVPLEANVDDDSVEGEEE
jgi:hypothetical protein